MSETTKIIESNRQYSRTQFPGKQPMRPSRHIAILACMDARLTISQLAGVKTGEAHIIRNAGGIATEDAIRSLIISNELSGTREFVVINHTDCGLLTFKDQDLQNRLKERLGKDASSIRFYSFPNLEENVRKQVDTIKNHPLIPKEIMVTGFIYDIESGLLQKVI
ncbi:MAG: carbonic anhydrase [Nitrososphaerota archaeon]|nr:carbonic anhydrase [Nitrososphaerota archaeon]MDG6922104.1 carbonic anhydrase [Nitrososphaerota archaeon]